MLECPSCQQELPLTARFCTRCGARLLATTTIGTDTAPASLAYATLSRSAGGFNDDISAQETLLQPAPTGFFQQALSTNGASEAEKPDQLPMGETPLPALSSADPYAQKKHELAVQSTMITASMESILSYVYENHRADNQALFASTLETSLPLEDPIWGRVAFVLGAYGNYMYRYPLFAEQKQLVWRALLWAVFYERCYRRKYLAQRCQQLLHFFLGCGDADFQLGALESLEDLSHYLEATSLKKLLETLQQMANPPEQLLQRVNVQLVHMQNLKQEKLVMQAEQQNQAAITVKKVSALRSVSKGPLQQLRPIGGPAGKFSEAQEMTAEIALLQQKSQMSEIAPSARAMLSFLTDEQVQEFFASLRNARLEIVNRILRTARQPLLSALLHALTTSGLNDYQPPRHPIRLGKKHADRFVEACRLLSSSRVNEQQRGLHLFEQGERETTHPDYAPLAHEWMLYARAIVQGSPRVVDDWESDLQSNDASWEEIWNLAFFYHQTGYRAESLRVLKPGLDEWRAPVAHLQLALACALKLLLEPGTTGPTAQQEASTCLLAHLEQWPHPLSCLAWLLLAQEIRGPLHPRQQSQRLSTFQELLEHPINLPDPQKDLPEPRVAALEDALVEKARCDEAWFFWINDYAEHHLRKYRAWFRLAETSERLGRLKSAELAFQHLVEIQYQHDYARYQEGTPQPRADYLHRNLENLFEFYQRHNLTRESEEAFNSCYPALSHLWDSHELASRRLIALTRQHQEARLQREASLATPRRAAALREAGKALAVPLERFRADQRVGIFVDYENIARFIPHDMDAEEVGKALVAYAAQFGLLVCQWASASPQNVSNLADVRTGLEAAGFKIRFPRRELQFSPSKKNLADFALLECLSDSQASDRLSIYLIVSGDRDYYERVWSLLDAGHIVRVIAAADTQHLSLKYRELEQQRAGERQNAGYKESDFFIDNLEDILYPLMPLNQSAL